MEFVTVWIAPFVTAALSGLLSGLLVELIKWRMRRKSKLALASVGGQRESLAKSGSNEQINSWEPIDNKSKKSGTVMGLWAMATAPFCLLLIVVVTCAGLPSASITSRARRCGSSRSGEPMAGCGRGRVIAHPASGSFLLTTG